MSLQVYAQIVADTLVNITRLFLFAYGIQSAREFLLHWLDSRQNLPLFTTPKLTREAAIDAARRYGITEADIYGVDKAA